MIHKNAKIMKPNVVISSLKVKVKKVGKDTGTVNKTILANNRNTYSNAIEYSKFLFSSETKLKFLM